MQSNLDLDPTEPIYGHAFKCNNYLIPMFFPPFGSIYKLIVAFCKCMPKPNNVQIYGYIFHLCNTMKHVSDYISISTNTVSRLLEGCQ